MSIFTMHHGAIAAIKNGPAGNFVHIGQNDYPYVQIGNQLWLAQNLREPFGSSEQDSTETLVKYGLYYDRRDVLSASGVMASGFAALMPNGWHIPSESELKTLRANATTFQLLSTEYENGLDTFGFNLKKSGYRQRQVGHFDVDRLLSSNYGDYDKIGYMEYRYDNGQTYYDKRLSGEYVHIRLNIRLVKDA